MQFSFKIFSSNNNVGTNELKLLPFRNIDFSISSDVKKHNQMVELVQRSMSLRRQHEFENNPSTLQQLSNQIEVTDKAIDKLVCQLYELSVEDIGLIEHIIRRDK